MIRSLRRAGLLAALCALPASSALAQFYNVQRNIWTGEHDHFCGNTWISNSATFNNAGSLIYTNSTFPTNTGPLFYTGQWSSGDYWWAFGVFDDGSDGAVINNTGTIQAIITGYGSAQAVGIGSLQLSTITNWGAINAQVLNSDGEAMGVWADSGGTTLVNNGTISARSQFSTVGVNAGNNVYLVNNGTIQSIADAGTQGISANQSFADGIGTGSGLDIPEYFENNGQIINICTSTTATNQARAEVQWANGPTVFKNSGFIYNASFSPNGAGAQGFYYGAQSKDLTFINSGTITNYCPGNGYALWIENDGDRGDIHLNNSGTITSIGTGLLFLTGHWGPPSVGRTYYTNTGSYLGGQMRFYGTPATIYEAGQVHTTLFGLSDNSYVHVMGLPTIDPTLECGGTNSTLEFNLIGTLQKVNGATASGTNLTALNLGQSGSIMVSGKTYTWSGAGSVSGMVNPAGCVPSPWKQQDIGSVGVSGGAVYCGGMFTVMASGTNIGGASDAFHFVYQTASNNCSIIAPLTMPQTTNPNAEAGVMIRDGLNASAANAFIGLTATNIVTFQYRSSDGGGTSSNSVTVVGTMHWVKLAQNGNALTGYYSVDGTNWTQLGSTTVSMGSTGYMGLAFCNNNNSSNGMGTFYGATCTGGLLVPSVPTGLTATAGVEQVVLNWQAASNTASYNIGRSTVSGGAYTIVGTTSGTNYTDRDLAGRMTYYYVVTAATPGSQSTNSAEVSATPAANVSSPWLAQDIGPVGRVGSESYTNGMFTLSGAGCDFDNAESYDVGTQDTCRFVYETNSGNCTIIARVTSVQNIDPESKAGVMIRSGLNADAPNVFVGMTPSSGVYFSCRPTSGAFGTLVNNVTNLTAPCWVSLVQNGTSFSGYYSADGNNWTLLGTTTVSMTGTEYLGMAVSSRDNWNLCTATFDNVTAPGWPSVAGPTNLTATPISSGQVNLKWNALTNATSYNVKRSANSGGPYTTIASGLTATNLTDTVVAVGINYYYVVSAIIGGVESANSAEATVNFPLPSPWVSQDIGSVGLTGSAGYGNNTFTVTGSGDDIWNAADAFRFVYVRATNNCTIIARVASLQNVDGWSKAGVMIRESINANAANAFIAVTPGNGVTWQTRSSTGGGSGNTATSGLTAPYWVKLVRNGNTFTGYYSPDGTNWTPQGTNTFTMASTAYVGLALTSHNNSSLCTATFDNVTAPGWSAPLPPQAPGGLAAAAVSSTQIALVWNAVTNPAIYNVKRSTTNGGPYTVVAMGVTATNYNDSALAGGTTYFYVVSAVNIGGESANSLQASATTPISPYIYSWSNPVSFAGLNANQILTNFPGTTIVGAMFAQNGGSSITVTPGSGPPIVFAPANTSWAGLAGGNGYTTGASTNSTGNANFNSCLNAFYYDGGPHIITLSNLVVGQQYSVQLFALDDRSLSPAGSARTVNWQNPADSVNVSPTYSMADNKYIVMTFMASNTVQAIQENLLNSGYGNFNCLILRAVVPIAAPAGLTAKAVSTNQINLTWNAVTNAASYNVKRSLTNGGPYAVIASGVTATNYPDTGLLNGTYYYVVSSLNIAGESTNSVQASATPQAPPALIISQTGTNFMFSWPVASAGFTLQSSTNLAPGSWVTVTSAVLQSNGGQWSVTLPPSTNANSTFYRLVK